VKPKTNDFEAKLEETVTAGFETKLEKTVTTGFEAKPKKTVPPLTNRRPWF
jgi:hypothetical protein